MTKRMTAPFTAQGVGTARRTTCARGIRASICDRVSLVRRRTECKNTIHSVLHRNMVRQEREALLVGGHHAHAQTLADHDRATLAPKIEKREGAAGIFRSLHERLMSLPDDVEVRPLTDVPRVATLASLVAEGVAAVREHRAPRF